MCTIYLTAYILAICLAVSSYSVKLGLGLGSGLGLSKRMLPVGAMGYERLPAEQKATLLTRLHTYNVNYIH